MKITPAAQALLDEANRLFPGRYQLTWNEERHQWEGHDTESRATHTKRAQTPEEVAQKLLTSARLSRNNGNRRHEHGHAPEARNILLLPSQWDALEAKATAQNLTVTELIATLIK